MPPVKSRPTDVSPDISSNFQKKKTLGQGCVPDISSNFQNNVPTSDPGRRYNSFKNESEDVEITCGLYYREALAHTMCTSGETLCRDNCQLICMSLIGLARRLIGTNRQTYFLLKNSQNSWTFGV